MQSALAPDLDLADIVTMVSGAWPFLAAGVGVLSAVLLVVAYLSRRGPQRRVRTTEQENDRGKKIANRLTFLVAVAIGALSARGMGHFFYTKLNFPLLIVLVGGGIFEIAAFTCALRARLNIKDPDIGKAGADGVAVWVIAGLSGMFSAMDAGANEVGLFQLVLPFGAAWLWERGMSIERRKVRGGSKINLRVSPERVLVWLRIAEPSGRTASEVDAHRRLTRVAKAASRLRALRKDKAADRRIRRAKVRLERAMRSAVAHAGLAQDPARQQALIAQLGSMYNADALADLTPQAPWEGFASSPEQLHVEVCADEQKHGSVPDDVVPWDDTDLSGPLATWYGNTDPAPVSNTRDADGNVSGNTENAFPWARIKLPEPWPLPRTAGAPVLAAVGAASNGSNGVAEAFPAQVNGRALPLESEEEEPTDDEADPPEDLDTETVKNAREAFATELGNGESISVRQIMARCNHGYPKAKRIKAVIDPE